EILLARCEIEDRDHLLARFAVAPVLVATDDLEQVLERLAPALARRESAGEREPGLEVVGVRRDTLGQLLLAAARARVGDRLPQRGDACVPVGILPDGVELRGG